MRYNGIYSFTKDGRVMALDLDEKAENPMRFFDTVEEFKKVFRSINNKFIFGR